jgi:hypothetical protein
MSTTMQKYLILVTRTRIITEEALVKVESEKQLTLLELRDSAEELADSLTPETWETTDIDINYEEFESQYGSSDIIEDDQEND